MGGARRDGIGRDTRWGADGCRVIKEDRGKRLGKHETQDKIDNITWHISNEIGTGKRRGEWGRNAIMMIRRGWEEEGTITDTRRTRGAERERGGRGRRGVGRGDGAGGAIAGGAGCGAAGGRGEMGEEERAGRAERRGERGAEESNGGGEKKGMGGAWRGFEGVGAGARWENGRGLQEIGGAEDRESMEAGLSKK
ncbi:hypothetical protein Tco_0351904 [Tanacetum coccineum]